MNLVSTLLMVAAAAALHASTVHAHGKMISPPPRLTNAKYNKDAHFSLRNAGNTETQIAPVELLNQRGQADNPAAPTFDILNGCRGIEYEAGAPVTSVTAGQQVPIRWEINAPHPGYMEVYIVKATKEASGKVMYMPDGAALKRIDDFAKAAGQGSDTVTIPATLAGCGTAGNCALQFYWYSPIAKQTYVNCADIVAAGTGNAASDTPASGGNGNGGGSNNSPSGGGGSNTPSGGGGGGSNTPSGGGGATNTPPKGGGGASNTPSGGGGASNTPSGGGGGASNAPSGGGGASNTPSGGRGGASNTPSGGRGGSSNTPSGGGSKTPSGGGGGTSNTSSGGDGGGSNTPSGGANTSAGGRANRPSRGGASSPNPNNGEVASDASTPRKKACNRRVRRA